MRTHRAKFRRRRAFTLFELLIVIVILLAMGGLVLVNLLPARDQADVDLQRVQIDQIDGAMKRFKLDMKRYPSQEEGLLALNDKQAIQDETEAAQWRGPYLEESVTKDNWNHELIYRFPGELRGEQYYDLVSLGPDGQEGTADDITNHDRHKSADGEIASKEPEGFAPPDAPKSTSNGS
ncbi:MAG: type II secretion system major pseudopilin GspG [Phycisphaerales bacterium]|nr:type II secretion system major pseudopilin GspG [Phycisphaerales bacterium]MCI0630805.1 type II secretion system major pseudopilin GspG [Phycisphaerales bacterium]MCI0675265.1 type II secretion system major pseudopilin GspG [Phycisphaerales bacterium]